MKDYKTLAMMFNTARLNMSTEVFNAKEMNHLLTKVIGFGKDTELLTLLSKKNIIRKVGRNQYMFPENPVYYGKIQTILQLRNKEKNAKYGKFSLSKAIEVCQKNGYTVVKYTA